MLRKSSIALVILCAGTFTSFAGSIVISGTQTKPSCVGSCDASISLSVSGGTGPYTYLWSNGMTTSMISGLCADTFRVVVTDAEGTTAGQTRIIRNPYPVKPEVTSTDATCFGSCNGTAVSNPIGGTAPYTYLWSNGATTASISNLCAGVYSLTVTDSHGCAAYCEAKILQPAALRADLLKSDMTCHGVCNGNASVTVSGGSAPYRYIWSNGSTASSVSTLCGGQYAVTVTDAHNCSVILNFEIIDPAALVLITSQSNVLCKGACNGSASVSVTGGNGENNYVWSTNSFSPSIDHLCAGMYTVTVTDSKGCTGTSGVNITEPQAALAASCIVIKNASYQGATDGQLSASATGGVSPYSYQWSNGSLTALISNLSVGTYTCTVSDANGCSAITSCSITAPLQCGGFTTYTQGGYGSTPNGNNPGAYVAANFAAAFPNGLTVGCTKTLTLTSALAVRNFLPSGTTARALTSNLINPGNTYRNVLAGQVVALSLSVGFDVAFASFGSSQSLLGSQVIANGTFAGFTVKQVLDTANKVLGGCASRYTAAQMNDIVTTINEFYDNGVISSSSAIRILCPGTAPRFASAQQLQVNLAHVYPNPFSSSFKIEVANGLEADASIYDLSGKLNQHLRITGNSIDAGVDLLPGVYMIHINYSDGSNQVLKVIKTN